MIIIKFNFRDIQKFVLKIYKTKYFETFAIYLTSTRVGIFFAFNSKSHMF